MSLLTICQDAATACGFPSPTSVVGSTDKTAVQLLSLSIREGNFLSIQKDWSELVSEHTFVLATADQDYVLPDDYRWIIPMTTFDRDDSRIVLNPLSSQDWQFLKAWTSISGLTRRARIRSGQMEFEATISAADNGKTIAFEYLSRYWAETSGGTAKARFTLDTDVARIDEELMTLGVIWRFRRAKGLDFVDERNEYQSSLLKIKSADGGSRTLSMNGTNLRSLALTFPNVPETGYGS
jgi:hypothetical protein